MKLSLRKAHALVKELQKHLRIVNTSKNIHHTADAETTANTICLVEEQNKAAVEQALMVAEAISDIRRNLQVQNSVEVDGNTVDSLLSTKVQIETKMRLLNGFQRLSTETQEERVNNVVQRIYDAHNSTSEYRDTHVIVNGYNVETHNEFNALYVQLKKEQEKVGDTLSYINNKLEIEIDDKYKELFKVLQVL